MSAAVTTGAAGVPARLRPLLLVTATAGLLLLGGVLASVVSAPPKVTATGGPVVIGVPDGWLVSVPTDRYAVLGVRAAGRSARILLSVLPGEDAAAAAAARMAQASQRMVLYSLLGEGEVTAAGRSWHAVEYVHVVPGRIPVVLRVRDYYRATGSGVVVVGYSASSDEFDSFLQALAGVFDTLTVGGQAP